MNFRGRIMPVKIGRHVCWLMPMLYPNYAHRKKRKWKNEYELTTEHDVRQAVRFVEDCGTPIVYDKPYDKGITLIPDFLANAGGVTCSYFEQVQSNMNYFWEKDEVLGKLDQKMTAAFIAVSDLARKRKLFMRDAAYVIAISRVAEACRERGWV